MGVDIAPDVFLGYYPPGYHYLKNHILLTLLLWAPACMGKGGGALAPPGNAVKCFVH